MRPRRGGCRGRFSRASYPAARAVCRDWSHSRPAKIHPRWQRLNELFFQAARLQGAERQAFIARETRGDPELERELLALLERGDERRANPLTRTLGSGLALAPREERSLVGRVVAKYQLVSVLGRGGAGTVFLGERADKQFSGKVAVKVVDRANAADLGMRFRAERQILASLNHPNIARLIDAGETDDGQPYLVMEYVEGKPLDQYCDERIGSTCASGSSCSSTSAPPSSTRTRT